MADGVGAGSLPALQLDIHDKVLGATMAPDLQAGLQPALATRQGGLTLRAALKALRKEGVREALEATRLILDRHNTGAKDWPDFLFVLTGLGFGSRKPTGLFSSLGALGATDNALVVPDPDPVPADPNAAPSDPNADPPYPGDTQQMLSDARKAALTVDQLTSLVGRALPDSGDAAAPPLPFALQLKNALLDSPNDPGLFCIRFVHTRPDCGPLHLPLISPPSEQFQLASFFDSDAPARPIRITLPFDTSPAGLRKFNKNTAFVLSDMLCGQVQRAKGLGLVDLVRSVLPWPLHKDLDVPAASCKSGSVDIGMICSLSIPIVTICALILLIIIVTLLDFIFGWLPYFILCFPVPGLKGKKD
jgi:hypothetical protein